LPGHIHKIWKVLSGRLIQSCGHFYRSYASNVLVLDLYSLSAALANHSNSVSPTTLYIRNFKSLLAHQAMNLPLSGGDVSLAGNFKGCGVGR
jgi:hypothetical protein